MKKLNLATITTKYKEILNKNNPLKLFLLITVVLGLTCFALEYHSEAVVPQAPPLAETVDTLIPAGKTLVPIPIMNYEYLDHIIGQYGVVDIYTVPLVAGEKAKLVLADTKIVRSPNNPNYFNALLSPEEALIVASHSGEFAVGVRNPQKLGTKIVKASKRRISFERE